jgi:hypothetical protein
MKTIEYQDFVMVQNPVELIEVCKAAGAAIATVIYSTNHVVVYYRDPQTNGIQDPDFVDELHIRHRKNARLLIAVFPVEN